MSFNNFFYYLRETFDSLCRNSWLSLASVGTIVVSLLILGSSALLVLNVQHLTDQVESSVEISVFIDENADEETIKVLGEDIKTMGGVESVTFISRDQALEELKESFGENRDALDGLRDNNTLPDSYRVKTFNTALVPGIAQELAELEAVEQVRYGSEVVERLMVITNWVRTMGLALVLLLGMAAVFLIGTTIRISVFARQREIGIMKVLGATNWFVRMPFLLEGMFLGLLGGLVSAGVIYYGYVSLVTKINASLPFIQLIHDMQIVIYVLSGLVVLGLLIGALGSAISIRRFLKV